MDDKDYKDSHWVKQAFEFIHVFFEKHGDLFPFHSYAHAENKEKTTKALGKAAGLVKSDLLPGLLAVIFFDLGLSDEDDPELNNGKIVERFVHEWSLPPEIEKPFQHYLQFLRAPTLPRDIIEQILLDGVSCYLALPDLMERSDLLRLETEKLRHMTYSDLEWDERLLKLFVDSPFYTSYAREIYGDQRRKNYNELKLQVWKLKGETARPKKNGTTGSSDAVHANRESDALVKIAFRNYASLVRAADRKAALLVHVSWIGVSVIIAYNIRHESNVLFIIPVGFISVCSVITTMYAIRASEPVEHPYDVDAFAGRNGFFLGSFDRVDRDFHNTPLDVYGSTLSKFLNGDTEEMKRLITAESYQVRRVLSRKFQYLIIAYKVFISGLILTIASFLIVSLILSIKR